MTRETPPGVRAEKSDLYERVKDAEPGTFEHEVKLELERLLNKIDREMASAYGRSGY